MRRTQRAYTPLVKSTVSVLALCALTAVVLPVDFEHGLTGAAWADSHGGGNQGEQSGGSGSGGGNSDAGSGGQGGDGGGQGQQGSRDGDSAGGSGSGGSDGGQRGQGGSPSDGEAAEAPDGKGGGRDNAGGGGGQGGPGGGSGGGRQGDDLGDLFGDTYVILRDENGVPILTPEGYVQPLDIYGNPIELNEEGEPVDEDAVVEVDLGRLNLGRSPDDVLEARLDEVIGLLNEVDAEGETITTDPAGRLVVTYQDVVTVLDENGYPVLDENGDVVTETVVVEKTIDSPLENLAIYESLLSDGALLSENVALTPEAIAALPTALAGLADASVADGDTDGIDDTDLSIATTFLAAATDKTGTFSTDEIAYINTILGINVEEFEDAEGEGTGIFYSDVDYSGVLYDRSVYDFETTVLVQDPENPGTWVATPVNLYTEVFDSESYIVTSGATLADWTQAADDAREVIEFIHEYEVPVDSTTD